MTNAVSQTLTGAPSMRAVPAHPWASQSLEMSARAHRCIQRRAGLQLLFRTPNPQLLFRTPNPQLLFRTPNPNSNQLLLLTGTLSPLSSKARAGVGIKGYPDPP